MSVPTASLAYERFVARFPEALKHGWTLSPEYPGQVEYAKYYIISPPQHFECFNWANCDTRTVVWAGMEIMIPHFFWIDEVLKTGTLPPTLTMESYIEPDVPDTLGPELTPATIYGAQDYLNCMDTPEIQSGIQSEIQSEIQPDSKTSANDYLLDDGHQGHPVIRGGTPPPLPPLSPTMSVSPNDPCNPAVAGAITDMNDTESAVEVFVNLAASMAPGPPLPVVPGLPVAPVLPVSPTPRDQAEKKRKAELPLVNRTKVTKTDETPFVIPRKSQFTLGGIRYFRFQYKGEDYTMTQNLDQNTIVRLKKFATGIGLHRHNVLCKADLIKEIDKYIKYE